PRVSSKNRGSVDGAVGIDLDDTPASPSLCSSTVGEVWLAFFSVHANEQTDHTSTMARSVNRRAHLTYIPDHLARACSARSCMEDPRRRGRDTAALHPPELHRANTWGVQPGRRRHKRAASCSPYRRCAHNRSSEPWWPPHMSCRDSGG